MLISREGYELLLERKEDLLLRYEEKKKQLGESAKADPDLPENLAFKELRVELQFTLPKALKDLNDLIEEAVIIEYTAEFQQSSFDKVIPGARVTFRWPDCEEESYLVAGSPEADPDNGVISYLSPLGECLIGASGGDEVLFHPPKGAKVLLIVVSVEKGL